MAEQKINVTFSADNSDLKQGIDEATSKLNSLGDKSAKAGDKGAKAFNETAKAVKKTNEEAGKASSIFGGLFQTFSDFGSAFRFITDVAKNAFNAAKQYIASISKLGSEAQKIGASAEGLQRLEIAAKVANVSADTLKDTFKQVQLAAKSAIQENKALIIEFAKLGISVNMLRDLTPEQIFDLVVTASRETSDSLETQAAKVAILGEKYRDLDSYLNGNALLKNQKDKIIPNAAVQAAQTIEKCFKNIKDNIAIMVANFAPFQWFAKKINEGAETRDRLAREKAALENDETIDPSTIRKERKITGYRTVRVNSQIRRQMRRRGKHTVGKTTKVPIYSDEEHYVGTRYSPEKLAEIDKKKNQERLERERIRNEQLSQVQSANRQQLQDKLDIENLSQYEREVAALRTKCEQFVKEQGGLNDTIKQYWNQELKKIEEREQTRQDYVNQQKQTQQDYVNQQKQAQIERAYSDAESTYDAAQRRLEAANKQVDALEAAAEQQREAAYIAQKSANVDAKARKLDKFAFQPIKRRKNARLDASIAEKLELQAAGEKVKFTREEKRRMKKREKAENALEKAQKELAKAQEEQKKRLEQQKQDAYKAARQEQQAALKAQSEAANKLASLTSVSNDRLADISSGIHKLATRVYIVK